MWSSWLSTKVFVASLLLGVGAAKNVSPAQAWKTGFFKTLVTFGDSYTDDNRLAYLQAHNWTAPPLGWDQPWGLKGASGGLSWARYASFYSDTKLYNYAVSSAVCDAKIVARIDIQAYELPTFIAESKLNSTNGTKFFTGTPDDTVYGIWIGTNDLGADGFLTDDQLNNATVKDYVDCVYDTIASLYDNGGRYFVLMNLAPLDLLPQYALPANGGLPATQYWKDKADYNATSYSYRMQQTVVALNEVFKYRTPAVSHTYPDMKMAHFDVNALMTDIWMNPAAYLNGTAPLNVTGVANQCAVTGKNCTLAVSPDSYLWYDELHPSEQASRVVAKEFVDVMGGESKWADYW